MPFSIEKITKNNHFFDKITILKTVSNFSLLDTPLAIVYLNLYKILYGIVRYPKYRIWILHSQLGISYWILHWQLGSGYSVSHRLKLAKILKMVMLFIFYKKRLKLKNNYFLISQLFIWNDLYKHIFEANSLIICWT